MSDEQPARRPDPTSSAGSTESSGSHTDASQSFWPEDYAPSRADYVCLTLIGLSGVYGLAVMFARPWLLQMNPLLLAGLSGSRSALVTIGALFATGGTSLAVVVAAFVLASISAIKLDLLFWWAGRLWGDFFVAHLVGDSKRKAKQAARAERLARRYSILAMVISNVPVLPVPRSIVFAVLGVAGTPFRKVLLVDLLASAAVQAMWLYLGYRIGEPVVQVVEVIARYALWITVAMLVFVVGAAVRKAKRQDATGTAPDEAPGERRD